MMNIISKKQYKVGIGAIALALTFSLAMWASYAYGEQSAGTSESGSTSYIKSLYTDLQTSSHGSDSATPDWGAYWNRFKTAAQWLPTGTVTAANVTKGKTFYDSNRTLQTGTQAPGNCPTQQYFDSYGDPATQTTNCTDIVAWTVPSGSIPGTEKQDPVSGLIWSNALVNSAGTVTFSTTTTTAWTWDQTGVANKAVGNKNAPALCSGMGNGWRLPTQKELLQAYVDGANFNLTQPGNSYWSVTWVYNGFWGWFAWSVPLNTGIMEVYIVNVIYPVRCVR